MSKIQGEVTYTHLNGKKAGPFRGVYDDEDNYLDVTKGTSGYPTALDIKKFNKIGTIEFKPNVSGKTRNWSNWQFFGHGQWIGDRFTELA